MKNEEHDRSPVLDLIVTHYNEPMSVGYKLFNMLCLQRDIDFSSFRVLIVQDGKENDIHLDKKLEGMPFRVKHISIDHAGVSAARNTGIKASDAEWVMFVDFDDTFMNIYSLKKFFDEMHDEVDLVYSFMIGEQVEDGIMTLVEYQDNNTFIHGKMFRRSVLVDNNIWFDPSVSFSEDSLFCCIMRMFINPARTIEIPEYLFSHCWNEGSVCRNKDNSFSNAVSLFRQRKALAQAYYDLGRHKNYVATVVKTVLDYYYATTSGGYPDKDFFERDFFDYWLQIKNVFRTTPRDIFALKKNHAHDEAATKGFIMAENVTLWDWIERMERKYGTRPSKAQPTDTRYPRVAVYHGTRRVYECMLASAKSLILHTNVEKIYFVIEDDVFPYRIPDMIETINVSDQQYIKPTSPNYKCGWTWMVMLRAAFSKLFHQYDAILSLDVDTIVDQNIDDIWNTDLSGYYYAAVNETDTPDHSGLFYTNMGVCLMNLAELRNTGMDDAIINELNTVFHKFTEQDVFNDFCSGHILELPSEYNVSNYTRPADRERIIHFAGFRDVSSFALIERYKSMSWEDISDKTGRQFSFLENHTGADERISKDVIL